MAKIKIKPSHKGLLHKDLGIPQGEKIPKSKLKVKSTDSAAVKKSKIFAQNFAKENGGLQQYDFGGNLISPFPELQGSVPNNQLQMLPSVESPYIPPLMPIDNTPYQTPLLDHNTTITNKPKTKTSLDYTKIPQFNIGSTNPYFASASNHFNNAIKFGFQAGMPKAANGFLVPTQEDPNYIDPTQNFDPQQTYYGQQQTPVNYNQNVLGAASLPTSSTFNPQLTQSLLEYNKSKGRPKSKVYGTPEELSQLDSPYQGTPSSKTSNTLNQVGNGIASGAESVLGLINTGKGILDNFGNVMQNKRVQQREAKVRQQAIYADAENLPPYFNYGNNSNSALMAMGGSVGGNLVIDKFKFIPKSENGSMIKEIGEQGIPNTEIEGGEHVLLNNGLSEQVEGPKHSAGGIPLNLESGSMIFSDKLKDPLSKKSYAKLAKPFETKKNIEMLEDNKGDEIQQSTNEKMIQIKNQKLQELFQKQEIDKLNGLHSSKIAKETAKEYQMKNGGIIKFSKGGQTREEWENSAEYKKILSEMSGDPNKPGAISKETRDRYNEILFNKANEIAGIASISNTSSYIKPESHLGETSSVYDKSVQPSGIPHHDVKGNALFPKVNWEANANQWTNEGFKKGLLNTGQAIPSEIRFKGSPQQQANAGLQEFQYDTLLDELDAAGDNYKSTPAYKEFQRMWKSGVVQGNSPEKFKGKDLKEPSLQDLKDLRGNFIDSKLETRHLNPTAQLPENPAVVQDKQLTPITNTTTQIDRTNQYNVGIPNLNIGIPNNYARDAVYTSQLSPQYIDPRYLDINPQLNVISRGKRSILNTLGDRSASSVSNALQGQINAYNQDQQVYGTKYNYDQQQDAHAQEFNANSKMNVDRENLGERNRFYDAIARREGVLDTQKRTDAQALISNAQAERNYGIQKQYIESTFNPMASWTPEQIQAAYYSGNNDYFKGLRPLPDSIKTYDKAGTAQDYTVSTTKKHGGRVKGKMKIKPKLKY